VGDLRNACKRRDAAYVRGWVLGRMMVEVPEDRVAAWLEELARRIHEDEAVGLGSVDPNCLLSDGTCDLYLKAQMTKEGHFRPGMGLNPHGRLTVALHVGWLGIWETPEQLARLQRRPHEVTHVGETATPGIERTMVKVQPIDGTAAVVAPVEKPTGT
jgi:hypothetical protein